MRSIQSVMAKQSSLSYCWLFLKMWFCIFWILSFSFPVFVCRTKKKQKNTQIKNSTSTNYGATYCFSAPPNPLFIWSLAGWACYAACHWLAGEAGAANYKRGGGARARGCVCVCVCVCVCACVRARALWERRGVNSWVKFTFCTCERVWSALPPLHQSAPRTLF